MGFSSVPLYLDPPNWQHHHQQQQQQQQSNRQPEGAGNANPQLPQPVPPPPPAGGSTGVTCSIRPGSMPDRAWLGKLPPPETALNCPRCESTNTKFCYFNNYSLTQPRHFCKTCRRYWTRGGALRNVPVGGGFRRNKKSKRSRSKSPVSTSSACPNNTSCTSTDIITHLPPPLPQLPFLPSLHNLTDFGAGNIGLSFGGVQPPVAAAGGASGGVDMEFQLTAPRFSDQWRMQQFPFLASLEPPLHHGMYQFDQGSHEGVEPLSYAGSKPLDSGASHMATVKMEQSQGLNLSRSFLGMQGSDQYWGGNAWTDLSGFASSSSTGNLL